MNTEPEIQTAAVVFRIDQHDRRALADFARELADSGCRLGGMVQVAFFDEQGRRTHIDSVDLATGDHVMINQPSRMLPDGKECTLDTAEVRTALVGVDGPDGREAVILLDEREPPRGWSDGWKQTYAQDLLQTVRAQPRTRSVSHVLWCERFPVDPRHNAKIRRELLAEWAQRRLYP